MHLAINPYLIPFGHIGPRYGSPTRINQMIEEGKRRRAERRDDPDSGGNKQPVAPEPTPLEPCLV